MAGLTGVDSIAFFGSLARGDGDRLSDRDILIVGNDAERISQNVDVLERFGWSVSISTWADLERSVASSSLFSLHLARESKIVVDSENRLQRLLFSSSKRASYSRERQQSRELISALSYFPNEPWGALWALDVCFVALRSYAVAYLAEHDVLSFSTDAIAKGLRRCGVFSGQDLGLIRELRLFKRCYRSSVNRNVNSEYAKNTIARVAKCIGADVDINVVDVDYFLSWSVEQIERSDNWYQCLRLREARSAFSAEDGLDEFKALQRPQLIRAEYLAKGEVRSG